MRSASRGATNTSAFFALILALLAPGGALPEGAASALDQSKLVQPGRLVIEGRRLTCGPTATLLRNFEGFADCYAVRRARREGWLDDKALDEICAVFNIAGHGPMHPDPEQRCNDLRQCFVKKSGITAQDGGH